MPEPQNVQGRWEWTPSAGELQEIVKLLQLSQSEDNNVQQEVQRQLDTLNGHPEFYCYLSYILGELRETEVSQRALSGLLLKSSIKQYWAQIPMNIRQFLKQNCFSAIAEESPLLRATVGIIITTVFTHEGCANWPELMPVLCEMLEAENQFKVAGALSSLQKICEDSADRIVFEEARILIAKILPFFQSPSTELRTMAVNTINSILLVQNEAFTDVIDPFIENLFRLANDPVEDIQKELCRSLTLLLECYVEKISPQLGNIAQFILEKTQHDNLEIAQEACEFWLGLAENADICKQVVTPILPQLIAVLLKCMRYSVVDLTILRADIEDDANVPDNMQDIRPRHHKTRNQMGGVMEKTESDDEEDDDDESYIEWSLRKCAAASLDMLSGIFADEFLQPLLPLVKECLQNEQWIVRESGILALGAVSEGCSNGMTPHLPELIQYLLVQLNDNHALVRSITCWTLSRYCHFVVYQPQQEMFKVLLNQLLARVLDRNKRVQEAACSAFATFEEEAAAELIPYLPEILNTLVEAFRRYQAKNLLILYDAIGTLADSVRTKLAEPQFSEMLMKPLLEKCGQLGNEDRELFPLLECISSVANAMGPDFFQYCETVFQRCINLINHTLQQVVLEQSNVADNPHLNGDFGGDTDKDFLVVALDLISELTEGVRGAIAPIISRSNLVQLTYLIEAKKSGRVRSRCSATL
ncbi:Importin-beta domain-containing protein [Aphelenchoides fujianensis]|nr:Importin-beta domain-containing protein [Aphelenchoides fujianensis]